MRVTCYTVVIIIVPPLSSPLLRGEGRRRRSAAAASERYERLELYHNGGYVSRVTLPHNQK